MITPDKTISELNYFQLVRLASESLLIETDSCVERNGAVALAEKRGCEGMWAEAFFRLDFLRPFASRQKDKKKEDTFNGDPVYMNCIGNE